MGRRWAKLYCDERRKFPRTPPAKLPVSAPPIFWSGCRHALEAVRDRACLRSPRSSGPGALLQAGAHLVPQFLARLEADHRLRRYSNRLSRLRVPGRPRLAPTQVEAAESPEFDMPSGRQRITDRVQDHLNAKTDVLLAQGLRPSGKDFNEIGTFHGRSGESAAVARRLRRPPSRPISDSERMALRRGVLLPGWTGARVTLPIKSCVRFGAAQLR